jgi:phosphoglycolate phosphatase
MTNSAPPGAALDAIVARTRWLLLDFDGPICSIYAGLPAPAVADQLRKLFTDQGVPLPDEVASTPDPMEVFAYAGTVSAELAARVEAEMTDLEVTATASAKPTPYIHDVLAACRESGRAVAVVSNNAERAVRTYLVRHGLDDRVGPLFARTSHDPALLKPSPHLIEKAVQALNADRAATALVGDSITDIKGAHLAGIASIGYANKPGKYERMTAAKAGAVITSLATLALKVRSHILSLYESD